MGFKLFKLVIHFKLNSLQIQKLELSLFWGSGVDIEGADWARVRLEA